MSAPALILPHMAAAPERGVIAWALAEAWGNRAATARAPGLQRTALQRLLKALHIDRTRSDTPRIRTDTLLRPPTDLRPGPQPRISLQD